MTERRTRKPFNPTETPGHLERIKGISAEAAMAIPYVQRQSDSVQEQFTSTLTSIAQDLSLRYVGSWNSMRPFDCITEISEGDDFKKLVDLTTLPSAERAVKNYLLMEQAGVKTMGELAQIQREVRENKRSEKTSTHLRGGKGEAHTEQHRKSPFRRL